MKKSWIVKFYFAKKLENFAILRFSYQSCINFFHSVKNFWWIWIFDQIFQDMIFKFILIFDWTQRGAKWIWIRFFPVVANWSCLKIFKVQEEKNSEQNFFEKIHFFVQKKILQLLKKNFCNSFFLVAEKFLNDWWCLLAY